MSSLENLSQDDRVTVRKSGGPDPDGRCVVYWMQRAQRALDNPALDTAVTVANELRKPVVVFFAPVPFYPHANLRHYEFLAQGIDDIANGLKQRSVGLVFRPYPHHHLLKFCEEVRPAIVIGDENPMREPEQWRTTVAKEITVPLWTVDADVMVPSRLLQKEQFAAFTIRPRIHVLLPKFDQPLENPKAHTEWKLPQGVRSQPLDYDFLSDWKKLDRSVARAANWSGGTAAGLRLLKDFLDNKLAGYVKDRNHPEIDGTSCLSPYLHFGHLGPHTVVDAVKKAQAPKAAKDAFLEQLIVRRELSVNFVRFNPTYDTLESREPWAERTLAEHARDKREFNYSDAQLEAGESHDPLWNAGQKQMVLGGWMHNYLRMYWAKKILEWSPSIAAAYQRAVRWNDKYELDGRDPNGYAGIAWAIVGKHDRAWFDRPIFGKIRYMSFNSTSKKFDSKLYIEQIQKLEKGGKAERQAALF